METYFLILISTVFVNNIVLVKILGLCPFMGVSRKLEAAIGMGAATTFVLTLASGSSYLINQYLLGPDLAYLRTLSFIVVIAGIVQFTEMFVHKFSPVLYQVLGIYLPLITTNCAVLGIPLLNVQENHKIAFHHTLLINTNIALSLAWPNGSSIKGICIELGRTNRINYVRSMLSQHQHKAAPNPPRPPLALIARDEG